MNGLSDAFYEGYKAYLNGRKRCDNPYHPVDWERHCLDWYHGWFVSRHAKRYLLRLRDASHNRPIGTEIGKSENSLDGTGCDGVGD